ncbi:hypothetical protein ACU8KH_03407 [Lachancea thermotolerans]
MTHMTPRMMPQQPPGIIKGADGKTVSCSQFRSVQWGVCTKKGQILGKVRRNLNQHLSAEYKRPEKRGEAGSGTKVLRV